MNKRLTKEKLEEMKQRAYQNKLKSFKKMKLKQQNKPEYVIMRNLQKIRISNRKFLKGFHSKNLDTHEILKFRVAYFCIKKGWDVIVEAIFENGSGVADIYIPFMDTVIEILDSEKPQNCIDKVKDYPVETTIMLETKKGVKFNLDYLEKTL